MNFTREELWAIREKAESMCGVGGNPDWERAYKDLAYATNVLDAHIARSTIYVGDVKIEQGKIE